MENYINILKKVINDNEKELENPTSEYTTTEIVWMKGYTQALKDIREDLINEEKVNSIKYSKLYKFNLN
jgi:predicted N-formylglutamate amidohydrolase|tara:strand:- start:711 stop:917 length:207 start_codon:yes stop_codon:yes gene_type:complete